MQSNVPVAPMVNGKTKTLLLNTAANHVQKVFTLPMQTKLVKIVREVAMNQIQQLNTEDSWVASVVPKEDTEKFLIKRSRTNAKVRESPEKSLQYTNKILTFFPQSF